MNYVRGDIFYVNYTQPGVEETIGSEQRPGRPAIIVSSDLGNEHSSTVTVVYLTTKEKRPMAVHVPVICKVPATALCEQIATISKDRLGEYVRSCTDEEMQRVDQGIRYALALNQITPVPQGNEERIRELEALLEAEKGNVSVLRKTLKEAENHAKNQYAQINELRQHIENMEEEAEQAEETRNVVVASNDVMLARAQAERDVYKGLFESLQAKMMERGA